MIPAATIVFVNTITEESTFDTIAIEMGIFALGLLFDNNEAANFLSRLRFIFEGIEKRLWNNATITSMPTSTA